MTDILQERLDRALAERDNWKEAYRRSGRCMTCALGASDHYGCTDCLNTGWENGEPIEATQARVEEREACAVYHDEKVVEYDAKAEANRLNGWWPDPAIARERSIHLKSAEDLRARNNTARAETFQTRVRAWLLACFGEAIAGDKIERNHRFLEEALELVQSLGCTQSEAHQLVDYVFNRPIGEPKQESGGVSVTHAALCAANGFDMSECADTELRRIWGKMEQIRAKQAVKPKHSPLPGAST